MQQLRTGTDRYTRISSIIAFRIGSFIDSEIGYQITSTNMVVMDNTSALNFLGSVAWWNFMGYGR